MKVVIPGGSGHVGTILAEAFHGDGHEVVVLSRSPGPAAWRVARWDGSTAGAWKEEIDGADVVINLAGRSVNCRYGPKNRDRILRSRIDSTRVLGEVIVACRRPPRVWLQASTATIYAHRHDGPNDEATGVLGGEEPDAPDSWRFSIDVAKAWERELDRAWVPGTRRVKLRSAITMSPDRGGPFDALLGLVRHGMGGRSGDGRQYVSWVHDRDFVRAIYWLIENDDVEGVVNIASPNPLPNAAFMRALRQAWGTRLGLPTARWMLEVGAVLLRTETELILKSRRVIPGVLAARGFTFRLPNWPEAARDLCRRWREGNGGPRLLA